MNINYQNEPHRVTLRSLKAGSVFCEVGKTAPMLVIYDMRGSDFYQFVDLKTGELRYPSRTSEVVPLDAVLSAKPKGTM